LVNPGADGLNRGGTSEADESSLCGERDSMYSGGTPGYSPRPSKRRLNGLDVFSTLCTTPKRRPTRRGTAGVLPGYCRGTQRGTAGVLQGHSQGHCMGTHTGTAGVLRGVLRGTAGVLRGVLTGVLQGYCRGTARVLWGYCAGTVGAL
jgi:hypothetical protein